jgi:Transposase
MAQHMSVLGIDIAKQVFHVVGMDDSGHVVLRKRLVRSALLTFMANVPPLRIGMEACGSAHDWARRFREHGHDVRLIAPQCVKASVKSPKHDARDAEAIGEAVTRPTMRFVPVKRVEQQDLQALHRIRERLIKARTALVHEIRGLLNEYGMVLPQSLAKCNESRTSERLLDNSAWVLLTFAENGTDLLLGLPENKLTLTKLDFCPFWEIEDCQKSLACLMAATALYAAGARADRMVSCKDCERFENCWEAAAV